MNIENFCFVKKAGRTEVDHVERTEGLMKTRQGGLVRHNRQVTRRAFALRAKRCPVKLLLHVRTSHF